MVVAHDEIDSQRLGIGNLLDSLNAAIEYYDKLYACRVRIIDTSFRDAVTIFVPVGNIVIYIRRKLLQKLIHQRNGCCAVNIVVAVNKYALFLAKSLVEPFNGNIHILHKERIMEMAQFGAEEIPRFCNRSYTSLHQQAAKYRTHVQLCR